MKLCDRKQGQCLWDGREGLKHEANKYTRSFRLKGKTDPTGNLSRPCGSSLAGRPGMESHGF